MAAGIVLVLAGMFIFRPRPLYRIVGEEFFSPNAVTVTIIRHEIIAGHPFPQGSHREGNFLDGNGQSAREEIMELLMRLRVRRSLVRSETCSGSGSPAMGFVWASADGREPLPFQLFTCNRISVRGRSFRVGRQAQRAVLDVIWELLE